MLDGDTYRIADNARDREIGQIGILGGLGFWYLADLIIAIVKAYFGSYKDMEDLYFDDSGRYIY